MEQHMSDIVVHIVDDDESVRKGLSRLMRSAGLESRTYESAEMFLNQVGTESHGCILLDITMSRMNGLELGQRLKEKGIHYPIIVVSAMDDEITRHTARDLGVRFFLRKPVDDQALLDAISWVMAEHDVSH